MKKQSQSPTWMFRILRQILRDREYLPLVGDFEEIYREKVSLSGKLTAKVWYGLQMIRLLPPFIKNSCYWRITMLMNYLKLTVRNLVRQRGYSVINILGLAIGLACCLIIILWVRFETTYDQFHKQGDNLYRVYSRLTFTDGRVNVSAHSFFPLARLLNSEIPAIENAVRYAEGTGITMSYKKKVFFDDRLGFSDPGFFDMFSFPLVEGNPDSAFSDRLSVVITEKFRDKTFSGEDPLGKVLNVNGELDLKVTGVIQNPPANSSLQFDLLVPFPLFVGPNWKDDDSSWGGNPLNTYILVNQNVLPLDVEKRMTAVIRKRAPLPEDLTVELKMQPLARMHLHDLEGGGLIRAIWILSLLAVLILFIACANFMNLSTARSGIRAREIGLRKVVGARKGELMRQFLGEALVLVIAAMLFALLLMAMVLPQFNLLVNIRLSMAQLIDPIMLAGMVLIVLITALAAGSYPALVLASFQPVNVFRGITTRGRGAALFRKALVTGQFSASILLIIGSIFIGKQLKYVKNKDLGYDKEQLISVSLNEGLKKKYEAMKADLLRYPEILNVSKAVQNPANIGSTAYPKWEGMEPATRISMNWDFVDYDYVSTMGMEIVAGRDFSRDLSTDVNNFIVNQEAVRIMGLDSPLGKRFTVMGREGVIIGVVKNFHFQPLHQEIKPFILGMDLSWSGLMIVRVREQNMTGALDTIRLACERFDPGYPHQFVFLEDRLSFSYFAENRLARMSGYFTCLAVFISCIGLLGMASYMVERRTKEIGVRKILGASGSGLIFLLIRDSSKWVIWASLLAWPIGFFVVRQWLNNFAYRTPIDLTVFLLSGLIALAVAVLTVGYQVLKATRSNPIDALRYE